MKKGDPALNELSRLFYSDMYSIMSLKSHFNASQILHNTSVVTFCPFVIFAIEEELTPESFISSFLFSSLSMSNFHNLL